MFIQVIRARAKDPAGLRKQMDRWESEPKPGAKGYLGATSGVATTGEFVAVVRFASEEAARANSDRPEQGAWWAETEALLEAPVVFHDCREVDLTMGGGSDDAGFVQILSGRATDVARLRALNSRFEELIPRHRPDVIGSSVAWHGDGGFTETVYFKSEKEAREGERKQRPPELEKVFQELMTLAQDLEYLDLPEPWMSSP